MNHDAEPDKLTTGTIIINILKINKYHIRNEVQAKEGNKENESNANELRIDIHLSYLQKSQEQSTKTIFVRIIPTPHITHHFDIS